MLIRCEIDPSIERIEIDGFKFPLGVYPVEDIVPKPGYRVEFEPADGPGDPQFGDEVVEPWPDRYVFDIVISADRVDALYRQLLPLIPGRVFPILDFIGHDAYREIDAYLARVPLGVEWLIDGVRACRPFFFEDGMVGFGALSDDPFCHLFVDEHKIITLRCEPDLKPRFEKVLAAFDLKEVEDPAGADAAAHEHRNVLWTPEDRPDLLSAEEIIEDLRDAWQLDLNIDITRNLDDNGQDLGLTPWRSVVRSEGPDVTRYAEILLVADCLLHAEELAMDATIGLLAAEGAGLSSGVSAGVGSGSAAGPVSMGREKGREKGRVGDAPIDRLDEPMVIVADRLTSLQLADLLADEAIAARARPVPEHAGVIAGRWLA